MFNCRAEDWFVLYGNGYSKGRTINAGVLRHLLGQQRLSSNLVPRERKLLEGGQLVSGGEKTKNTSNYFKSGVSLECA